MSDLTSRCPGPRFPPPVPLDGNPGRVRNSNSIPYHTRISLLLAAAGLLVGSDIRAQEWTRFRGPNGTGISTARGIPSTWTTGSCRPAARRSFHFLYKWHDIPDEICHVRGGDHITLDSLRLQPIGSN